MQPSNPSPQLSAGIGLLSGAVMLYQVCLTRVFSFSVWHHFAFMIVSVALLGFALSGVALRLRPALGSPAVPRAAAYALGFGLTAPAVVWFVTRVPFDPTRLAHEPRQLAFLAVYYGALLLPFTFAGLAIVTLLQAHAGRADRLYGSDLVGAGLGCLASVLVIERLGAEGALLAASLLASLAALVFAPRQRLAGMAALAAVLAGALVLSGKGSLDIPAGPGKGLHAQLDRQRFPDARLAYTKWNAISRVDVVENAGAIAWTSDPVAALVPRQTMIVIDGDAGTPIIHADDVRGQEALDGMLSSVVLEAFRPQDVLVIGAGGGVDVRAALRFGARHVDAVEVNPAIVQLMRGRYAALSGGLFARPEVELHLGEGRSFVRHGTRRYDLVQLSLVDTWAASVSGAYSLAEGYLYTVEAFRDYLARLSPTGTLNLTRWLVWPPRESLKLCTVAAEALRAEGRVPAAHVVVLGRGDLSSVMVKREPFTAGDLAAITALAPRRGFSVLHPLSAGAAPNAFSAYLQTRSTEAFYRAYPFDVRPATDDSPFFFNFGRWRDARILGHGWKESPLALSGRLLLLAVLVQAVVLSLVLLVLPSVLRHRSARGVRGDGRVLLFFFLIGLAFMLVEMVLMQRLTLFLGHPVYALALVLAVLLLAAGLGSLGSRRLAAGNPWPVFVSLIVLISAHALLASPLLDLGLVLELPARLLVAALLLFPLGFALGIPFPAALMRLGDTAAGASLVPWAWAANGCASVIGPVLAMMLALDLGFTSVLLLAAAGYGAAYLAFPWRSARAE